LCYVKRQSGGTFLRADSLDKRINPEIPGDNFENKEIGMLVREPRQSAEGAIDKIKTYGGARIDRGSAQGLRAYSVILITDVIMILAGICLAVLVTYVIQATRHGDDLRPFLQPYLFDRAWQLALLAGSLLLWLASNGHYRSRKTYSNECKQLVVACVVLFVLDGYIQYALKLQPSRIWIALTWISIFGLLAVGRRISRRIVLMRGLWGLRTLVVGTKETVQQASNFIVKDEYLGYEVAGALIVENGDIEEYSVQFDEMLRSGGFGYVVFAFDEHWSVGDKLTTKISSEYNMPYGIVPSFRQINTVDMEVQNIVGEDLILLHTRRSSASNQLRAQKRIFDIVVSLVLLAVCALPMALIAALVRLDGGKVLYCSTRIGRFGREFCVYKFRSMVPNAEEKLKALLETDEELRDEWNRDYKLENDPRITAIGRFLRRTSLDELPQLYNVIRGDMSLVGPRPIVPDERTVYEEKGSYGNSLTIYNQINPGITGLWQVSGRNDIQYQKRVELNNWYVRNWSMWGDFVILLRTIGVVTSKSGAK